MVDKYSRGKRQEIMRSVRAKDTAPERIVENLLESLGLRFQRHVKGLPGTPDFYFPDKQVVVFVHGCFWHGHQGCSKGRNLPKSNRQFWRKKLDENILRDQRKTRKLRTLGVSVYRLWECEIKGKQLPARLVNRLK